MVWRDRIGWLIVLASAAGVLLAGVVAPKQNWDMVAYVAASYAADGYSGRPLAARTYADVRQHVDASAYSDLTAGPYRATVARDFVALEQQLPFYTPRLVYITTVRGIGRLTGSYTQAAHLVAALFAFMSAIAMGTILARIDVPPLILPLLVSPIGLINLARLATPDSMACFASLLLVLALFRPNWWAYALLAMLPAIRSDYLIFSALGAIMLFAVHDRTRAVIAFAAATTIYVALGRLTGNYGYVTLLNFTLFGQQPYPARLPISTDPGAYAAAIATDTNYLLGDGIFLIYAMALVLLWRVRTMLRDRGVILLLILPATFATVHFALFPSYDKRFLVSSFFLVTAAILRAILRSWPPPARQPVGDMVQGMG